MSHSCVEQNPYSGVDFLSLENLSRADEVVAEVFHMMFGFVTELVDAPGLTPPMPGSDDRTAVVGFSGSMRGSCQVRISSPAARAIASAMLGGVPIDEDDDSINDALGELCNMLAGGWKNAIPALSSACALSPPTVISGHDYKVHVRMPSVNLSRTYRFDVHTLQLTLHCEQIEPHGQ
jgi:chemotaxis protein CheX